MRVAVFLLCFLLPSIVLTASAQDESVTVTGQDSMTGVWRIKFDARPEAKREGLFCRVAQTRSSLSARCLPFGGKASGSIDGDKVHLSWPGQLRWVSPDSIRTIDVPGAWMAIDARLQSPVTFTGMTSYRLMGLRIFVPKTVDLDTPIPSSGTKFQVPADAPDTAGKAGMLSDVLMELAGGGIAHAHDQAMAVNLGGSDANTPEEFRGLGEIVAILYLGEGSGLRHGADIPPLSFSVYQVEFAKGERLCGIHQRDEDGVLDAFLCV